METTSEWAAAEFGTAALGDVRRTKRLIKVAAQFAERPAGKITEVMQVPADREAAFRFVENEAIDPAAIAMAHELASACRCRTASETIIAVDQTSLTLTDRVGKKGLGSVGSRNSQRKRGLQAMSALAVTSDGVSQGLVAQQWWSRHEKSPDWKRDKRPSEERESVLWRRTLIQADELLRSEAPETVAWYQLDRGGDSAAVLQLISERGLKATIRSAYNRKLAGGGRLRDSMRRRKVLGHVKIQVPVRGGASSRRAKLSLRAGSVTLVVSDLRGRPQGTVTMQCVHVREARPPRCREGLEWWLLTTASVRSLRDALRVVDGYRMRWRIEAARTWSMWTSTSSKSS